MSYCACELGWLYFHIQIFDDYDGVVNERYVQMVTWLTKDLVLIFQKKAGMPALAVWVLLLSWLDF